MNIGINPFLPLRAHFRYPSSSNGSADQITSPSNISYSGASPPELIKLDNGLRILLQRIPAFNSSGVYVWVDTGSVHESEELSGISHFIEHIVFKGTKTRSNLDIVEETEGIGADLNAFTSEENTSFHTLGLGEFSPLLLEVLLDMLTNPKLDPEDIKKEQDVVVQEIKMYRDESDHRVLELASNIMFKGHPYGRSILGTEETVRSFTKDKLEQRIKQLYVPQNMIISISGNFDQSGILSTIEKIVPAQKVSSEVFKISPPQYNSDIVIESRKDIEQAHLVFLTKGVSLYDDDRYVAYMINTALGGGMSSRLFQEIREKRGLVYTVNSMVDQNKLGGLFGVYLGCEPSKAKEALEVVIKELEKLKREGLSPKEFAKARMQLKSHLLLRLESTKALAFSNGRNQLNYDRSIPIDEINQAVGSITNDRIIALANKIFDPKYYTLAVVGKKSKLPKASSFKLW